MLRGKARGVADNDMVKILDKALVEAVKLASRYIAGRQVPDKAVSVLDTACAKIAIGQNSIPADIEDARQQRAVLATERELLKIEAASGAEHGERMAAIDAEDAALATGLEELEARWEQEKTLVAQLHEKLDALDALAEDRSEEHTSELQSLIRIAY